MPVQVRWLDETIIQYTFLGHWSWKEYHNANHATALMLEKVDHRIDVIVDMRSIGRISANDVMHELQALARHGEETPYWGIATFIGMNALLKSTLNTFVRIHPTLTGRLITVESEDQAMEAIMADRQKKADLGV
jgi:hypothetical protein